MPVLILLIALALAGCGTKVERTTKTVEREDYVTDPVVVDTFAGSVTIRPMRLRRFRTEDTFESMEKTYQAPEIAEFGGAMLGGLGGPLAGGGIVGLIAAWFMKRTTTRLNAEKDELLQERNTNHRRFVEVVEGIEHAKGRLGDDAWDKLTDSLERKQSRDTMDAVREKTT